MGATYFCQNCRITLTCWASQDTFFLKFESPKEINHNISYHNIYHLLYSKYDLSNYFIIYMYPYLITKLNLLILTHLRILFYSEVILHYLHHLYHTIEYLIFQGLWKYSTFLLIIVTDGFMLPENIDSPKIHVHFVNEDHKNKFKTLMHFHTHPKTSIIITKILLTTV